MASINFKTDYKQWRKDNFVISTDPSLIPIDELNAAFETEDMNWATGLPLDVMKQVLQNSLCFGIYETKTDENLDTNTDITKGLTFIGFGRCMTDYVTLLYLTDVYVSPSYRARGLGQWLISCIQEVVDSLPYLRRMLLITFDWKRTVPYYEKHLGMTVLEGRKADNEAGGTGFAVMQLARRGHHA